MTLSPTVLASRETREFVEGGSFDGVDLRGSDLTGLRVEYAKWTNCDFREADFEDFRCMNGNLSNGRWEGAALLNAMMMDVSLVGGVFDGCLMERASFPACDYIAVRQPVDSNGDLGPVSAYDFVDSPPDTSGTTSAPSTPSPPSGPSP